MAVPSATLGRFAPSAIGEIFSLAIRLKEEGRDIVNLSIGEPDFDTPDHIKQAAWRAIKAGQTKYTGVDGTTELKQAVQRKFARDNEIGYGTDEIVVASGAKPLLFYALQALVDHGDEVIIPTPCWTSYPGMVRLAGGETVLAPTAFDDGFKLSADALAAAITAHTKCIILCSPSNPTGAAYSADELKALTDVLVRHPDIWVITDDLYEKIVFDGFRFTTAVQVEPRLRERTLTVNGVSKCHAMTGWRVGFAGGPKDLIAAVVKIMSQSTGSPCSISQAAAVEALDGPQEFLAEWAAVYQRRRDMAVEALDSAPGLGTAKPEGSFYLFPNCGGVIGRATPKAVEIDTSGDFVRYLLEDWGVALVPGAAFEADPFFRMSCAVADDVLEEGLKRIVKACKALN